ncbi:phage tail protein [Scytonema hofmannii PCC 7110]|uniref:Phage tail protein n=2 Tax=Scytonema hofmannii TaxID=34078 RepID=A0A139XD26_9CYAN|nr:phage tail protein [Scytonema hofmannii PCC 7110]
MLVLSLTSMQLPETTASTSLSLKGDVREELVNQDLLGRPGETSEMLLKIENTSGRPLRWKLEIEGDFPNNWYSWSQLNFDEIDPNQKVDKTISFHIPNDFFENQSALSSEKRQLKINYQSQISLYLQSGDSQQLIDYRTFNLIVRPKTSYQNLLPEIYREADFAARFVSIFEQAFDPAVQIAETLWAYLDPLTAPKALLPFLAHWVAWEIDDRWTLDQQRRLIRNAITLYRWHGTSWGLRLYLHLYTGLPLEQIQIREIFNQGFVFGPTRIGEDSMLGGGRPYHFQVELQANNLEQIDEKLVREIIERQKPGFCSYELDIKISSF